MSKIYHIRQIRDIQSELWNTADWAEVNTTPWPQDMVPYTRAQVVYHKEFGFGVRMECLEGKPRKVYTEQDSPVYEDSCMEFFINFNPKTTIPYLNFEVNANGAMRCQLGSDRYNRSFLKDLGMPVPKVKVVETADRWQIEYWISHALIYAVYGTEVLEVNKYATGNFYKCGDETAVPHYSVWSPLTGREPNFHQPEQFGVLQFDFLP